MDSLGAVAPVCLTKECVKQGGSAQEALPRHYQCHNDFLEHRTSNKEGQKTFHFYGEKVSDTEKEVVEITFTQEAPPRRYACDLCHIEFYRESDLVKHRTNHKESVAKRVLGIDIKAMASGVASCVSAHAVAWIGWGYEKYNGLHRQEKNPQKDQHD